MEEFDEYFSGERLYGDDFPAEKLDEWYADEKEGYSALKDDYEEFYCYEKINEIHGYSRIMNRNRFEKVLCIGGAKGEEIRPVEKISGEITILEPSEKLKNECVLTGNVKYVAPKSSGKIAFHDNEFDLVTSFGVLHHIPNVSYVFGEMARVTRTDGYILVREPIVSMGDWRKPRGGLTKRERGIPEEIFDRLIRENDLEVVSKRKIMFPLLRRIRLFGGAGGSNSLLVLLDYLLSILFSWNRHYHSTTWWHKLQPQSVFYVLVKR